MGLAAARTGAAGPPAATGLTAAEGTWQSSSLLSRIHAGAALLAAAKGSSRRSTPARPSSSLLPRRGGSCSGAPTCPAWRSREAMAELRARRRAGVRSGVADSRPWRAGASGGRPARGGGMERWRVRAMAGAPWPPWPARGGSRGAHGRGAGREPSSGAAAARRCGSKGDERMGEAAPLDRTWLST